MIKLKVGLDKTSFLEKPDCALCYRDNLQI